MRFALRCCTIALLTACGLVTSHAQEITFNFLEGDFELCEQDSMIRIRIVPTPNEPFTEIRLAWTEDPDDFVIISDTSQLVQSFTYDLSPLLNDCDYANNCLTTGYGYCVEIQLGADYENITSQNVSKNILFRKRPDPAIAFSTGTYCVGEAFEVTNATCPNNDPNTEYEWTLPDGTTATELTTYTPTEAGDLTFTLTATNGCAPEGVTVSRTISVQELPVVDAQVAMGAEPIGTDSFRVCLNGTADVLLTSLGSQNVLNYRWTASGPNDQVLGSLLNDSLLVRFDGPGDHTFTLEGSNGCQTTDEATLFIEVLSGSSLSLDPQGDACPEIVYTPTPLDPEAVYRINGVVRNDFPVTLPASDSPYVVEATKSTPCGDLVETIEFRVFAPVEPTIAVAGTEFCRDTTQVALNVDVPNGDWAAAPGLVLVDSLAFFDLDNPAGEYTFTYTVGSGDCERSTSVTLRIADDVITLPADFEICSTAAPVSLAVAPTGGSLSGAGVANDTIYTFDPAGLAAGNYDLTYVYENTVTGCTETGRFTATVIEEPTLNIESPVVLCNADLEVVLSEVTNFTFTPAAAEFLYTGAGITDAVQGGYTPGLLPLGATDTVVVTYTNLPGCRAVDTLLVNITEINVPSVGADTTICGGTGTFALGPTQGGRWTGPQTDAAGTVTLDGLAPGTYSYTLTLDPDGLCQSSRERTVTLVPEDGVNLPQSALYLCDTAAVIALPAGMPLGGDWAGDLPVTGNTADASGAGAGAYDLTYTIAGLPAGCNTAGLTVNVLERPATAIIGDSLGCAGGDCVSFSLTANTADRYRWDFGDGQTATDTTVCHSFADAGQYAVELTAYRTHPLTGADLCATVPATAPVRVLDRPPVIGIRASTDTICPGETIAFERANSVTDNVLSYVWDFGFRLDSVPDPGSVAFPPPVAADTTYVIYLTTTNPCAERLDSMEVFVRAAPRAEIGVVYDQPCSGADLIVTNRSTGSLDEIAWRTSDGQTFASYQPPVLNPLTDSLPRELSLELIVGNACRQDTARTTVTINPTDVRALPSFADTTICLGTPFVVTNNSTPDAPYRLTFSDGNTYTADTVAHEFAAPGVYDFTVVVTGCGYDSSDWRVRVIPLPDIQVDAPATLCPYEPFEYAIGGSGTGYLLRFGDGDSTLMAIGNHRYAFRDTTVRLSLRATAESCVADTSFLLTILPQPVASGEVVDTVCAGQEVAFSSTGLLENTCRWRYGDGNVGDGCAVRHTYERSGRYPAELIVTSPLGCTDTASLNVFVEQTPRADFALAYVDSCGPVRVGVTTLTAPDSASSYFYDLGDGRTRTERDFSYVYPTGGSFAISLRAGWNGVCFDTLVRTIDLPRSPNLTTAFVDERCVPGDYARLDVFTPDAADEILLFGPNGFYQDGIDRFEINQPGPYELEVISPDGCDTILTFELDAVDPLVIRTIADTLLTLGDSIELTTIHNAQNLAWSWTEGAFLSDTAIASPVARPLQSLTTFIVTATDSAGCFARDTVNVEVAFTDPVYVPTAFSPNGDGKNDALTIFPKPGVTEIIKFHIYDRWGELLYGVENAAYDPAGIGDWDGTVNGRPLNPQVLVYWLQYEDERGETATVAGSIHLISARGG